MQDLEYLIEILKFCEKLTKVVPGGVVHGCNPLEGTDCYALKCTKITLFARLSAFPNMFYNNTSILLYVLSWQVGGYSPPKSATAIAIQFYLLKMTTIYTVKLYQNYKVSIIWSRVPL